MAAGYVIAPWATPAGRRENSALGGPNAAQQQFMSSISGGGGGGGAPQAPGFGDQQSAMDRFFQLKQAEALQQVAKRADNLSAARGLHIDGGVSTQMEQELGNDAIGQLNQQQAGANADLMAQQRAYAMEQQRLKMQQDQWNREMQASQQQQQYENQMKDKLYADMRSASTGAGGGGLGAANPYSAIFGTGESNTGSVIGGPATSGSTFGQSNLASHNAPKFGAKAPDRVFTETSAQAAARGANLSGGPGGRGAALTADSGRGAALTATGSAGFDYSGMKNTGGHQVPGVSSAGPGVSSLGRDFSTWARR